MKNLYIFLATFVITITSIALFSCRISCAKKHAKEDEVKYLDSQGDIYTKGDTLRINGKKYIKVYGITKCKYGCPVLIEID